MAFLGEICLGGRKTDVSGKKEVADLQMPRWSLLFMAKYKEEFSPLKKK